MLKKIGKQKTRWLSMLLALTVICLVLPSFAAIGASAEGTPVNLALGKTATASSVDTDATVAGKAVDGQDNTSWSSSGRSNADPFNEWLMVDLGEATEIGRYVVKHHGSATYNTQDFRVEYSANGSDWTLADTVAGNTDAVTSRMLPDAVMARYVRLVVTKPEDLEHTVIAARIKEFELYAPSVTVSSSNVNSEYPAENVLKDDSSQWVALNCSADNPQWVMIDFGKTQTFNRWIVNHFQANNHAFNTSDYQLQYKQGDAWITADTVTGNQAGSTDRTVEAFTARYVRLYITKPTYNGDNNVRITRFALSNDGEYTATYSASSVNNNQSLYTADKAFDGNTTTEWVSNAYPNDGSQMEWLQIDFGHRIELNRWIVMHHGVASGNGGVNTREYALQYKQGDEWITADTVTGNTAHSTDRTVERFTARYVRLAVICPEQGNTGNGVTRIVEFAVSNDGVFTPKYSASGVFRDDSSLAADKAFDNDDSTIWASRKFNENGGENEWLAIDFGDSQTFSRWIVKHWNVQLQRGESGKTLNTRDFKLQYSATGDPNGTWIDVDEVTNNQEDITDRSVGEFTARYVRLLITAPVWNDPTQSAHIVEFALTNDGTPNPKYSASGVFRDDSTLAADKAFDNDDSTIWASRKFNENGGENEWLAIDFGRSQTFNHWLVKHWNVQLNRGESGRTLNTRDFKLQYSQTGDPDGTWIDVDAVTGNLDDITDRSVDEFTARYLRLLITAPVWNDPTQSAHIVEFAVDYVEPQPISVTFVGKYNETVAVKTATSAAELATLLTETKTTDFGTYHFIGWNENAQNAQALFDAGNDITVTAVFMQVEAAKGYHLTVGAGVTAKDGLGSAVDGTTALGFDQRITVTAEGKVAYWVLDGAKVGFGKNTYTFYVSGNNSIEAVTGEAGSLDSEVVLQQATYAQGSECFTLTVIAQTSIPSGNVSEYGVIFTSKEPTTAFLSDPANAVVKVKSSKTGANQQYMAHLLNVKTDRTRYARAYAIVNGVTIYSTTAVQFKTTASDVTTEFRVVA
ncbi:MAG: discoidin domain-containing protein [Acutalibacteraceae bacterium]|jgi:hypothetical protein